MLPRRYLVLLLVPVILIIGGTLGYYYLEGWSLFDSLYMTVITLTTVGYGETHELTLKGRAFTMLLLLGGVFTLIYTSTEIIRSIVSGELQAGLGKKRMERSLAELKNHLIVCGFGRMGKLVCKEFSMREMPFVVIDRDASHLENYSVSGGIPLHGDATSDEILKRAGVERARALVTVVASDADNLYITMSARLLNEKLFIVARSESGLAESKLVRAGANRVVSPYAIGGFRVAQAVLQPNVVDFIELATRTEHLDLQIEETQISEKSRLAGMILKESHLRQELGIIIVAIKKSEGKMIYNPPGDTILSAGDILIALGHREQMNRLDSIASG